MPSEGYADEMDLKFLNHVWYYHEGTAQKIRKEGEYFDTELGDFVQLPDWFLKSYSQTMKEQSEVTA